jgi:hypothetical protein
LGAGCAFCVSFSRYQYCHRNGQHFNFYPEGLSFRAPQGREILPAAGKDFSSLALVEKTNQIAFYPFAVKSGYNLRTTAVLSSR